MMFALWVVVEAASFSMLPAAMHQYKSLSIFILILSILVLLTSFIPEWSVTKRALFMLWSSFSIVYHLLSIILWGVTSQAFLKDLAVLVLLPLWGSTQHLPLALLWSQQLSVFGTLFALKCQQQHSADRSQLGALLGGVTLMAMLMVYSQKSSEEVAANSSSSLQAEKYRDFSMKFRQKEQQVQSERDIALFISHEVRNPLFNISNAMEFMDQCLSKLERLESLEKLPLHIASLRSSTTDVKVGVQHCTHLLTNVLNLSKIEQGKVEWNDKVVNLSQLCNGVLALTRYMTCEGVLLKVDVSKDIWVLCDEQLISQVLVNLVANALKFTVSGFVLLRIKQLAPSRDNRGGFRDSNQPSVSIFYDFPKSSGCSESEPQDFSENSWTGATHKHAQLSSSKSGGKLSSRISLRPTPSICINRKNSQQSFLFEVCDTGPGISTEKQGCLFQRFQQAGNHFGAGLGLMLAQKIIQFKKSNIEVVSPTWYNEDCDKIQTGSVFRFSLELNRVTPSLEQSFDVEQERKCARAIEDFVLDPNSLGYDENMAKLFGIKILLVDDSPLNLKQLRHKITKQCPFQQLQWVCEMSQTGTKALELLDYLFSYNMGLTRSAHNSNNSILHPEHFSIIIVDSELSLDDGDLRDGRELVRQIRKAEKEAILEGWKHPRMLLISYSGHIDQDHQKEAFAAGADICWSKPLPPTSKMLQDILQSYCFKTLSTPAPENIENKFKQGRVWKHRSRTATHTDLSLKRIQVGCDDSSVHDQLQRNNSMSGEALLYTRTCNIETGGAISEYISDFENTCNEETKLD